MYKEPIRPTKLICSLVSDAVAPLDPSVTPLMSEVGPHAPLLRTLVFLTRCSPCVPEHKDSRVASSPSIPRQGAEPGTLQVPNAACEEGANVRTLLSVAAGLFLKFKGLLGLRPPTFHPEKQFKPQKAQ